MKSAFYLTTLLTIVLILMYSCNSNSSNPSKENDSTLIFSMTTLQGNVYENWIRGEEKSSTLIEMSEDKSSPEFREKALKLKDAGVQMDKSAGKVMEILEKAKSDLLTSMGQNLIIGNPKSIMSISYSKQDPIRPSMYFLDEIKYVGNTKFLSPDSDFAKSIVPAMKEYRKNLCELFAASAFVNEGEKEFYFKDPMIEEFEDFNELYQKLDKSIATSNVSPEDREILKKIYTSLMYNEIKWGVILNEELPWTSAFGALLAIQSDVLNARTLALTGLTIRTAWHGASIFKKLEAVVVGPETAYAGDDVYFEVYMAAMSEDLQPTVTVFGGAQIIETRNGRAFLKVTPPVKAKEITIAGEISLRLSTGIVKTQNWKKKIVILPEDESYRLIHGPKK